VVARISAAFRWSFVHQAHFTTDACLYGGGAACLEECLSFVFPTDTVQQAAHITALELFVVVVVVRVWAPLLAHRRFMYPVIMKRPSMS